MTAHPAPGLRGHAGVMAIGAALGLASTAFTAALNGSDRFLYLGILLGAFGAVYLGFAVADGRTSSFAVQYAGALLFLNLGFIGAREESHVLLGIGFLAHAAWDWWHHDGHGPTRVRTWYPPFCAVADVIIGVPVLVGWV